MPATTPAGPGVRDPSLTPGSVDHAHGAFPRASPAGRLTDMADRQRDVRVSDDSTESHTEESGSPEPATVTVGRMLANPRRVRRN